MVLSDWKDVDATVVAMSDDMKRVSVDTGWSVDPKVPVGL